MEKPELPEGLLFALFMFSCMMALFAGLACFVPSKAGDEVLITSWWGRLIAFSPVLLPVLGTGVVHSIRLNRWYRHPETVLTRQLKHTKALAESQERQERLRQEIQKIEERIDARLQRDIQTLLQ